ncbi:hypothetical protein CAUPRSCDRAFT_11750 [Caulochytrium protostelioides]|uniref:Uncharacterized protein n=1 Tax=Caulochytrium protostelioides TaxID=1555241 RepID=A0A4V1ITC3_9FUNG|nr:hypothetical protein CAUPRSCDRAFT_11750 [Caulochytrium protostelioides]
MGRGGGMHPMGCAVAAAVAAAGSWKACRGRGVRAADSGEIGGSVRRQGEPEVREVRFHAIAEQVAVVGGERVRQGLDDLELHGREYGWQPAISTATSRPAASVPGALSALIR